MDKKVQQCLDEYKKAEEAFQHNKETALEDIKFALLSEQWDQRDRSERMADGRPCLTFNKLSAFVRQIVNDARENKPSIIVHPVDDDADPETAKVMSGIIRNVEVISNADIAYDTAIQQSVSGGFGYARVNIEYTHDDSFDKDIIIERIINQFSVTPDPDSTSADGSDWNKCWVTDRIPKDEFKSKYPKAKKTNWTNDYHDDYVNDDGVWVCEYWVREESDRVICLYSDGTIFDENDLKNHDLVALIEGLGLQKVDQRTVKSHKVTQYIMSGAEVLETNEWAGKYIPIVPIYGEEIIVEGKKYYRSAVHNSKDAQKNYNFWRTTSTESVSDNSKTPYVGEEGSFVDTNKWSTANRKKWAYLEYKKGMMRPTREPYAGIPAGAIQEAMNSADDVKATMGMFDASLGAQGNETSGRAIVARQRQGDTSTFHFIDNSTRFIRQLGKVVIDLIPKVYTGDRIVRVLGEDNKVPQNVRIGQSQDTDPSEGEGQQQEGFNVARVYDLTIGKYDLVVDSGPSYTTKRMEAATQMTEMIRAFPQLMQVAGDILANNLDWPGAHELAERMKLLLPPQLQDKNPELQQMQQQMQLMQQQAQAATAQLQGEIEKLKADKGIEIEKLKIDAFSAETDRLKVVQTTMTPEQVQALATQTVINLLQTPDITPQDQQPQIDPGMMQQQMQQAQAQQPMQQQPMMQPPQGGDPNATPQGQQQESDQ